MKKSLLATALILTAAISTAASADDQVAGHPRINEVNQRIDNQQQRIANQEAAGKITPAQAAKDDNRLANESQRLSADEAKNNGHITKQEQRNLNKSLNKNNRVDNRQERKDGTAQ